MNLLIYFWLFFKASLFSTGGMGNLPSLHSDLLPRNWATEANFGEALAVGQLSPGPNGLWVVSFGYLTAGFSGALLALAATTIPPFLILAVDRLYRKVQHHAAVEGFVRGLGLAVVGVFVVTLIRLLHGTPLTVRTAVIVILSFALGAWGRIPVVVILLLAGMIGVFVR